MDNLDAKTRSRVMSSVKPYNTRLELRVRRVLHAAGLRYGLHRHNLPGRPDIILSRHRMVVFVHGCFWHWHGCSRCSLPKSNRSFWVRKLNGNRKRDRQHLGSLRDLGWRIEIIWECQVERATRHLVDKLLGEVKALKTRGRGRRSAPVMLSPGHSSSATR